MARSLRWLWTAAARPGDLPTDAELLARFTAGDHAAFELLVRRHAAAVWAACRGILRNDADADDAAQVTFFTLARHARSVRAGANLGGWLHRVAVHAALKMQAKRRPTVALPNVPVSPADSDDTTAVLHEELARLPAAYREVLVAVDLEGYGHADAAKALGWPVGTVSGRIVRARVELRRRLERRGVTAAVVAVSVGGSSIRAAVEVAVGAVVAPPRVISLSTEVWVMMATAKQRLVGFIAAGLMGLAVVGGAGMMAVAQPPKPSPSTKDKKPTDPAKEPGGDRKPAEKLDDLPEVKAHADDPPEVKAAKEVLAAGVEVFKLRQAMNAAARRSNALTSEEIMTLADMTAAADDAFPDPRDRLPWYEYRLAELKLTEDRVRAMIQAAAAPQSAAIQLRLERAKAELALAKVQKKLKK